MMDMTPAAADRAVRCARLALAEETTALNATYRAVQAGPDTPAACEAREAHIQTWFALADTVEALVDVIDAVRAALKAGDTKLAAALLGVTR